jgi:hypothetical protein
VIEQVVRAGKTRVFRIHRRCRNTGEPQRTAGALNRAGEGMRIVRRLGALGGGRAVDEQAAVLDLDRVRGNAVALETGLANAAAAVKFPVVPGADDVIAVE